MRRLFLLVALSAVLVACENATAPDAPGSAMDDARVVPGTVDFQSPSLPFHRIAQVSNGDGEAIGWCDEAAGVLRLAAPGVGTLTHAGRFEIQQTNCVDLATGAITGGIGTLTTANGDEIHLEYSGRVLPGVVPETLDLDYVVVGGTGRFEHAAGELHAAVVYTSATTWVSDGDGWLRYAASDVSSR